MKRTHSARNHSDSDFNCKSCGKVFKSETGLSIHMEMKRGIINDALVYQMFECGICNVTVRSKRSPNTRMDIEHARHVFVATEEKPIESAMK